MYSKSKSMLTRILDVFEKYDNTNITGEFSDDTLVNLVTSDAIAIACFFSGSDGIVSQANADVFNFVFGTERTPDDIKAMISDDDSIMKKIGRTFNVISETEKRLGIYSFRKTMIVPLVKFFESFAMDILKSDGNDETALGTYNIFFYKIESALTEIPS